MLSLFLVSCVIDWCFWFCGESCLRLFVLSCVNESSDSSPDWSSDLVRLCAPYLPFGGLLIYGVFCVDQTYAILGVR